MYPTSKKASEAKIVPRGVVLPSKKVYEIFQDNKIFRDFLWLFLRSSRTFAKGVGNF